MYQYYAFGLTVKSAIPISGFLPDTPDDSSYSEAETIVVHRSDSLGPADPSVDGDEVYVDPSQGLHIYRLDDGFFLRHRVIGRLRTVQNEIIISPEPTADPNNVKWLVANLGLRLIFIQRGNVVFHASAVDVDGSLVAFTGPSGRGKSTLAAACYAAGHTHHSDDLVPILTTANGKGMSVPPGPARIRINDDVRDLLQLSPTGRTPRDTKSRIDTTDDHSTSGKELDVLYLIEEGDKIAIDEIATHDAVYEILRHSYALYRNSDSESASTHLDACGTVAQSVDVRRLSRPRSLQQLDRLAAAIEQDVSH